MSDIKRCDYQKEEIGPDEEYYIISIARACRNSDARVPSTPRDCCAKCFKAMEPKAKIGRPRKAKIILTVSPEGVVNDAGASHAADANAKVISQS